MLILVRLNGEDLAVTLEQFKFLEAAKLGAFIGSASDQNRPATPKAFFRAVDEALARRQEEVDTMPDNLYEPEEDEVTAPISVVRTPTVRAEYHSAYAGKLKALFLKRG